MSAPPGHDVGASMLPATGGTIHAMHGGSMTSPYTGGVTAATSLLWPARSQTSVPKHSFKGSVEASDAAPLKDCFSLYVKFCCLFLCADFLLPKLLSCHFIETCLFLFRIMIATDRKKMGASGSPQILHPQQTNKYNSLFSW